MIECSADRGRMDGGRQVIQLENAGRMGLVFLTDEPGNRLRRGAAVYLTAT